MGDASTRPLINQVWPRSAAFINAHHRRMTRYAEEKTSCARKGVACTVHRWSDRSYVLTSINGPKPGATCTGKKGACGCEHAEIRALDSIDFEEELIFFVTFSCCRPCAEAIVGSGVVRAVAYRILAEHHGEQVNEFLEEHGVHVYRMEQLETDVDV